ncbi:hypothetical protein K2Y00_01995 [Patescibacteria group bacterium]|nr:hypothetical protein [Patescibacteria group bacterium]
MIGTAILFFVLSIVTYVLFAWFGHLTGGSPGTFWQDVFEVFKPMPLAILIVGNLFFAAAVSIGLKISPYAIPMAIAIGVIASFVYSMLFLGGTFTWVKTLGIGAILVGIYLLK